MFSVASFAANATAAGAHRTILPDGEFLFSEKNAPAALRFCSSGTYIIEGDSIPSILAAIEPQKGYNTMAKDQLLNELERQEKYLAELPADFSFPLFNTKRALDSQRQNGYRNTAVAAREIVDNRALHRNPLAAQKA